ncbi:L domain-like protein [Anaeromyces robustus]|uniref:L domain-like protein n=1 Tax=Anaeromyces robustus TaxID=1754192 RepID=A0A1Y1WUN4_9FUNG|nr:L domain-like protein [Anaeromyces robustus]|eukprot:ORX77269.1 L domain-like protein [Anaeromyces robustus]
MHHIRIFFIDLSCDISHECNGFNSMSYHSGFDAHINGNDCQILENAINKLKGKDDKNILNSQNSIVNQDFNNCCQNNGISCEVIDNNNNNVTEMFFEELANLKYLYSLTIINSKNINYIPENIGNLYSLKKLVISKSFLSGTIPKTIGKLENLTELNLNNNQLSGVIPNEFKNLNHLEKLDLSFNVNLDGYVPLLPNIKSCNYLGTELCNLKNSNCISNDVYCTTDEIKNANNINGISNTDINNDFNDNIFNKEVEDKNDKKESMLSFLIFSPIGGIVCIVIILLVIAGILGYFCSPDPSENSNSYNSNPINSVDQKKEKREKLKKELMARGEWRKVHRNYLFY